MLAAAQTIILERGSKIHWEAVLVTAVPAFFAAVAAMVAAYIGTRNKGHLQSIDKAVNGTAPGVPTIRDRVEQIDRAVNGAEDDEDSIRENVQTLIARKDMDPDAS